MMSKSWSELSEREKDELLRRLLHADALDLTAYDGDVWALVCDLEAAIKAAGLQYQYFYQLIMSVAPFIMNDRFDEWGSATTDALWDLLHATSDQRCEAAVMVLEAKGA